ncbi:MAG: MBL fold metallo-hydrolase [Desulfovibrio sp.]|uniref:MBL fold metallo-hydrolase n=1 Tax=Desulfovibrio sp. TaxID=885 RepID=UPI001A711A41|nr:MBL fold metallo-hydrolase [Desulfovibrio sp.]MBD5416523.1 MBL fold metallo-hydrolase [Desulfovibrio sp.]
MIQEILALTIGKGPVASSNHFYMRPDLDPKTVSQHYFWVIMDDTAGPVVVDTGYAPECLQEMKLSNFTYLNHPRELLNRAGIDPVDVRHVILTHLHWDHWIGEDLYPNATYYIHERELGYVTSSEMRFLTYARHYNFKRVEAFMRLLYQNRVHVLANDREMIVPGIETVLFGAHTPGLMGVVCHMDGAKKIITSDVAPRYRNVAETTACGIHYDVTRALTAVEQIGAESGAIENVIPCHDPEVGAGHEVAEGVVKVA